MKNPTQPTIQPKKYDEFDFYADDELSLLQLLVKYPGVDPYSAVSGCVRLVAVDRWLNKMMDRGWIIAWESDDGNTVWAEVTDRGKKIARAVETA